MELVLQSRALLQLPFWNTPLENWLIAFAAFASVWILLVLLRKLLRGRLGRLVLRIPGRMDDLAVSVLRRTHGWFLFMVALYAGSQWITLPTSGERYLDMAMGVLAIVQFALWAQQLLSETVDLWTPPDARGGAGTASVALKFLCSLAVWSLAILFVLRHLGVEVVTLITGLGVGGIAAALALQTVLGDLFASLAIFTDRPFDIGDFIVVGDFSGTVNQIGLRSTRLVSLSGEQLILPNGELMKSRIRNYRRMQERRIVNRLSIEYGTAPEKVAQVSDILRELIGALPEVRLERVHFAEYGESALIFELVYNVLSRDYAVYATLQETLNLAILRRFQREGIGFAFPTRTLLVQSSESSAPGVASAGLSGVSSS